MRCFLLVLLALSLNACDNDADTIIRFGLANGPENLDPRFATDAVSARVNRLIYNRLVDFDDQARPVPALASWQRISSTHYRFSLHKPLSHFHDGSVLTAQDVKATYDYILDPENTSPHRATVEMIDSITVLDEHTLDFRLTRPDRLFPAYLAIGILPAELAGKKRALSRNPIGSGPFRFVKWHENEQLELERLADGQRFRFLRIKDATVRVLKLVRGELDLIQNDLPVELISWLERRDDIQIVRRAGTNFSYLGFNMADPVTRNPAVRSAIAHGIDREAIIRHVFANGARRAGAILPGEHWAGNEELRGHEYDPEKARQLLKSAGLNGEQMVSLSYKTSTDPLRVRLATIIQSQLAEIGVDVQIQSYDWGTFYGDIKAGRFQAFSLMWVGIKTPDIFRYVFHSASVPPGGANRGRYRNPDADRLIERADTAGSEAEMAKHYRGVQEVVARDLPYIPLWFEDHVIAYRNTISDYTTPADGNYDGLIGVQRLQPNNLSRVSTL